MPTVIPHLPAIGNRIRLAIQYEYRWRPLIWIRLGRDGSIYAGLLMDRPGLAIEGETSADRGFRVDYRIGQTLGGAAVPSSSRVSFKASGEVHLGNRTVQGYALEHLQRPTQLCLVVFTHPSRYREPRASAANDY
jgi:hypothetical protein